jgi:putative Ca2+/H+ antiporter (TMEM165/GDT1 family)
MDSLAPLLNYFAGQCLEHATASLQQAGQTVIAWLNHSSIADMSATAATSFTLIAAAEMGDKSQLVCMTLASKNRATPIIFGAIAAFACLNSLAVIFGAAIASWLPSYLVASVVALLFAGFGLNALLSNDDVETEVVEEKTSHSIFFTTLLLITVAEFGDKTQLAVVALSSSAIPAAVWLGATLALASTSALGVLAGRTVLQKMPLTWLHRISGVIFLCLAILAAYNAYCSFDYPHLSATMHRLFTLFGQ